MYDIAEGMQVHLPAEFVLNGRNEPTAKLHGTYLRVHTAVNRMLRDIVNQRLAFLLPKMDAIRFIKNLHLSAAHWTVKKGKPSGRPIGDLTYVAGMPLNSEAKVKQLKTSMGKSVIQQSGPSQP